MSPVALVAWRDSTSHGSPDRQIRRSGPLRTKARKRLTSGRSLKDLDSLLDLDQIGRDGVGTAVLASVNLVEAGGERDEAGQQGKETRVALKAQVRKFSEPSGKFAEIHLCFSIWGCWVLLGDRRSRFS
jgi:hypothetical protein